MGEVRADVGVLDEPVPPTVSSRTAVAGAEPVDEAGTAPGDRRFRPDVEGLRAVAILLVVLYHAGLRGVGGGYVGVDVFFVISGFVITGVLLRERSSTGRTSLAHFYARRARRILPAATLVIVVTVIAAYIVLWPAAGNQTAIDSRWAEVFLANFHFAGTGTNYLNAHQLPSALQNFWSLAIEEQFYLVYPTFFLVLCSLRLRMSNRSRLLLGLGVVVVASFIWSVVQTSSSPTVAYFSPFTRAWELALGAMVALATDRLVRLPKGAAAVLTWTGLAAIVYSAVAYGPTTAYPGAPVVVPVVGAALVIAGGTAVPTGGAELLLGTAPLGWLGRLSYSLYLWHWPILILAAESAGKSTLSFHQNLVPLVIALAASIVTFYLYETPIRHLPRLRKSRNALAAGAGLVVVALIISTLALVANGAAGSEAPGPVVDPHLPTFATPALINRLVHAAPPTNEVPQNLAPSLVDAPADWSGPGLPPCFPAFAVTSLPLSCMSGQRNGSRTVVIYGDSHAAMWGRPLGIASAYEGWRELTLGKGDCPAADLQVIAPSAVGPPSSAFGACPAWQRWAIGEINDLHPNLVVLTEEYYLKPGNKAFTSAEWQAGLERTIAAIHVPRADIVVLGNIPEMRYDPPVCLERHPTDVGACNSPVGSWVHLYSGAEAAAARAMGVRYVNVLPWFCSTTCSPVIGHFEVYFDQFHMTDTYSTFLSALLSRAIGLSPVPRPSTSTASASASASTSAPAASRSGTSAAGSARASPRGGSRDSTGAT